MHTLFIALFVSFLAHYVVIWIISSYIEYSTVAPTNKKNTYYKTINWSNFHCIFSGKIRQKNRQIRRWKTQHVRSKTPIEKWYWITIALRKQHVSKRSSNPENWNQYCFRTPNRKLVGLPVERTQCRHWIGHCGKKWHHCTSTEFGSGWFGRCQYNSAIRIYERDKWSYQIYPWI